MRASEVTKAKFQSSSFSSTVVSECRMKSGLSSVYDRSTRKRN